MNGNRKDEKMRQCKKGRNGELSRGEDDIINLIGDRETGLSCRGMVREGGRVSVNERRREQ